MSRVKFWHGLASQQIPPSSPWCLLLGKLSESGMWLTGNVVLVAPILLLVHYHPSAETTSCLSHVFTIPVLSGHLHPFTHPLCGLGARGPPRTSQQDALAKPPSSQAHLFAFPPKWCVNKARRPSPCSHTSLQDLKITPYLPVSSQGKCTRPCCYAEEMEQSSLPGSSRAQQR